MSEHGSSSGITNAVDALDGSLPVIVDLNLSSVVNFETSFLEGKATSESVSADRY